MAFDIPYPPNYGGVIDIYYKIKKLNEIGCQIILHTYEYGSRKKIKKLNELCTEVYYYKRKRSLKYFFSFTPFIVVSRTSKKLSERLQNNHYPIIFEGLHTTAPLIYNKALCKRAFVRTHNIEHQFYFGLCKSEQSLFKKIFFWTEGLKLKRYEKILDKVEGVFTISKADQKYFSTKYGNKTKYIPVFHPTKTPSITVFPNTEKFLLYHGDLRVPDNVRASIYLINIFKNSPYRLVIASSFEKKCILKQIAKHKNVSFKNITDKNDLSQLLAKAQINILVTFQKTGIKLKLMNCLFKGKHIIANTKMIDGTGLENLCHLANSKQEILEQTKKLIAQEFVQNDRAKRKHKLKEFCPLNAAACIQSIIFKL